MSPRMRTSPIKNSSSEEYNQEPATSKLAEEIDRIIEEKVISVRESNITMPTSIPPLDTKKAAAIQQGELLGRVNTGTIIQDQSRVRELKLFSRLNVIDLAPIVSMHLGIFNRACRLPLFIQKQSKQRTHSSTTSRYLKRILPEPCLASIWTNSNRIMIRRAL